MIFASLSGLKDAEAAHPGVTRGLPSDADVAVYERFPLLVDSDGLPLEEVLSFTLSKVGSANSTLAAYVQSLARFADFLQLRKARSLLSATSRDLTAYRIYRTETSDRPIADYSFRVEASALRQFYTWAVQTGRLSSGPVKPLSRSGRDNLTTNRTRHSKIRHVENSLFALLVETAGEVSATSNARSAPGRNVAALKTLISTGLRIQELAALLTLDVDHGLRLRHATCVEMESITKYQINRNAMLPAYATEAIRRYRKLERPNVVFRHQRTLRKRFDRCFVVSRFDATSQLVAGVWQGRERQYLLHRIPIELRLNAVAVNADDSIEPLCLFIGESRGLGMTRSGWEGIFSAMSDEIIRRNPADDKVRRVTPHDLRHTFAINYLRAALDRRRRLAGSGSIKDRPPLRDPLVDLQELLGHASSAQTLGYLRYVEDIDRVVADAVLPHAAMDESE